MASRRSSTSSTDVQVFSDALEHPTPLRFSAEEEASLLQESNAQRSSANTLFATSRFSEAIDTYDKALASCPNYLDYEIAVLKSNIAACHLKLGDWKAAVESATASLGSLDRVLPPPPAVAAAAAAASPGSNGAGDGAVVAVELTGDDDAAAERELKELRLSDERREQAARLRAKVLLRRARANTEQGGWGTLAAAEGDYRALLSSSPYLPERDRRFVRTQLGVLPARVEAAKAKETGEMMDKLKELGNGILKPFGLSTDMFKMVKDESTGGYSMSFGGAGGAS